MDNKEKKHNSNIREIPITQIEGICIGQTENPEAGTGCTVAVCKEGMRAGLDIRGGGPASRDSQLLNPLMTAQEIHAVVLSGGSAFGLGAAGGVMDYLEARDIGYDVGITKVPLVAQSDIFDLTVGDPSVRPGPEMGKEAARLALEAPNYRDGIGSYALQVGELQIGAIVALNALGDVFDWKTGRKVAGLLSEDKRSFRSTTELMMKTLDVVILTDTHYYSKKNWVDGDPFAFPPAREQLFRRQCRVFADRLCQRTF